MLAIIGLIVIAVIVFMILSMRNSDKISKEAILKLETDGFKINKRIHAGIDDELIVDDEHKQIAVRKKDKIRTINYSDITGYELCEDGGSISEGNWGGALVGGLAFGTTGAIIGSSGAKKNTATVSSILLNLMINDINSPIISIPFLTLKCKKDSGTYKSSIASAREAVAVLKYIEKQGTV